MYKHASRIVIKYQIFGAIASMPNDRTGTECDAHIFMGGNLKLREYSYS